MSSDNPAGVHFPLQEFFGFSIEMGEGAATVRLTLEDRHMNPHGPANGAVTYAMMDTAMGAAAMSVLDDGSWITTIDMQVRYHRPAWSGDLRTVATVLSAGRRVVHVDAKTYGDDDRLVASATGGFAPVPAPDGVELRGAAAT